MPLLKLHIKFFLLGCIYNTYVEYMHVFYLFLPLCSLSSMIVKRECCKERIQRLYLSRWVSSLNEIPWFNQKSASDSKASVLDFWGKCTTPLLQLLSSPRWSRLSTTIGFLPLDQSELFNNLQMIIIMVYWVLFPCMRIIHVI